MSKESLEQFVTQIADSEELRTQIEGQLNNDDAMSMDELIELGAAYGCNFSVEDLNEAVELSDDELDGVAGGAFKVQGTDLVIRPTTASAGYDSHKFTLVGRTEGTSSRPSIFSFGVTGSFTLDGKGTD